MRETDRFLSILLNGEKADDRAITEAIDAMQTQGYDLLVQVTEQPGDEKRLIDEALRAGVDGIVAVGGDGTLNDVLHGLYEAEALDRCAVGVVPKGTANDFATACGIPLNDPLKALKLAVEVPLTRIDIGCVNDRFFINAASGGYGAEITATTPPNMKKMLGGFAYLVNGLMHIPELEGKHTRVTAPGFAWEGKMVGFTVANGRLAGGGFRVAPHALLDDGLLDLTLFPEVEEGGWAGVVGDLLASEEEGVHEYLVTCRASRFEMTVQEALHVNLDGEPFQDTVFRFNVLEKQALVCLPPTSLVQR